MFLVTGATGNVGSEVVSRLLGKGEKVRVFARDASRVAHWGERIEVAIGDFGTPDTFASALAGVDAVFLMTSVQDPDSFARLVDAAKDIGVPRVVFMSTIAASLPLEIGRLHRLKEDAIRAAGFPLGVVRPGGFMSNTLQWVGTIRSEGAVFNAMGAARFPAVAPEDVAAVAVEVLTRPELSGEVHDVTGGELLSVPEQVATLTKLTGKPIRCVDIPVEVAVSKMVSNGIPGPMAAAIGASFQAVREGRGVDVKDTVQRLTGRAPITFESWASKHSTRFS